MAGAVSTQATAISGFRVHPCDHFVVVQWNQMGLEQRGPVSPGGAPGHPSGGRCMIPAKMHPSPAHQRATSESPSLDKLPYLPAMFCLTAGAHVCLYLLCLAA